MCPRRLFDGPLVCCNADPLPHLKQSKGPVNLIVVADTDAEAHAVVVGSR